MPGISLAIGAELATREGQTRLEQVRETMKHEPSYDSHVVISENGLCLGWTGYPSYPMVVFESGEYRIVIEGHVYNRDARWLTSSLDGLVCQINDGRDATAEIGRWVRSADGDYLVTLCDLANWQVYLFNDAAGRLPIYVYQDDQMFLLSREVKFLAALMPSLEYDRQGIAETLCFGYPLGKRTLVARADRMDFGTLIHVDVRKLKSHFFSTYSFNFEECRLAGKPVKEMACELRDLFVEGCRQLHATFGDRPQVVSLSGGLDSRSVAAGMLAAGAKVHAATFQDAAMPSKGIDASIAEQVADSLGIGWQLYDVNAIQIDDIRHLLAIKDGMNYAGMAFILPFFRDLRAHHGEDMVYYTGDVGDRTMEVQAPPRKIDSFHDLVEVVLSRNSLLDVGQVAALTSLDREEFRSVVEQRLREYPERDMNARYIHFLMAERLGSWNWQAEDRNRCFFWSATPFSLFAVFDYAMNVPNEAKRFHRLYEQFMKALAPQCVGIDNANWRAPFASRQRYVYPLVHNAYARLPTWLRHFVKDRYFRGFTAEASTKAYFDECLANCPTVQDYLSRQQIAETLRAGCGRHSFENLLTVAGYVRGQEEVRTCVTQLG